MVFNSEGNESCYRACLLATEAESGQGSRKSQLKFDEAIELCPTFDYAYFEKAVPYLKRGEFLSWKELIDKAVQLNPSAHLGYRGWCRFQFLRDYKGAIEDLETLKSLMSYDIGYSMNGNYHLNTVLALSYKQLGNNSRAIEIMETHITSSDYVQWTYEYLHLGVMYLETGDFQRAINYLLKQIENNDYLSETYYYLAMSYSEEGNYDEYLKNLIKAKEFYEADKKLSDSYTTPVDKIYLLTIETEMEKALKQD